MAPSSLARSRCDQSGPPSDCVPHSSSNSAASGREPARDLLEG